MQMKLSFRSVIALFICTAMLFTMMPAAVFAAESSAAEKAVTLTEGDVVKNFVKSGTACKSADESVAWVDKSGSLNALKEGSTVITAGSGSSAMKYIVTVSDYSDGSDVVGRLKLIVRCDDAEKFAGGHAYLLFTSYKDGLQINTDDLYCAYEISDRYYKDIRESIANGSNHRGTDADKYFSYTDDADTMVLDRGELVTIGMYRDFSMSMKELLNESLRNSSLWGGIRREGKTAVIEKIFGGAGSGESSTEKSFDKVIALLGRLGLDYSKWMDGTVKGGVCFNRELYTQKLSEDQYENVTYAVDITQNQLDSLAGTLGGRLDNYSLFCSNSATLAADAWNAAVGTRNGKDTAYKLEAKDRYGRIQYDSPNGLRKSVISRLPGYWLNNSAAVAEPDAGFRDSTGWVYVSAPAKLSGDEPGSGSDGILKIAVSGAEGTDISTEIYTKTDGQKHEISSETVLTEGTKIYIKPSFGADVTDSDTLFRYALADIRMNGSSVFDDDHYDAAEGAYYVLMPDNKNSKLNVKYAEAELKAVGSKTIQLAIGSTLDIADQAELILGSGGSSNHIRWGIVGETGSSDVLKYTDKTHRILKASAEGEADIWAYADGNDHIGLMFHVEVYKNFRNMVRITYNDGGALDIVISSGKDKGRIIPASGYRIPKGTVIGFSPAQTDGKVLASLTCNKKPLAAGKTWKAYRNTVVRYRMAAAAVKGVPSTVKLAKKGDKYQLKAKTKYTGSLMKMRPVYDKSITYVSSDPLVTVSEKGLIRITGDIPKGGKAVYVTAYAGSGNHSVKSECKVIAGDYKGSRKVGKLTIVARPILKEQMVGHGWMHFKAYEDTKMNISYYTYHKPAYKFVSLVHDYEKNPDKYDSDPVFYNDDALKIKDRESYFDIDYNGKHSDPEPVSIKAGESISFASYMYDNDVMTPVINALANGDIATSADTAEFLRQLGYYKAGNELFDGEKAFDGLVGTFREIYRSSRAGHNSANGEVEGGISINREAYKAFTLNFVQTPNNSYSVEITADELAALSQFLADPANNYVSPFVMNCTAGATIMWNQTLADRPEFRVKSDPMKFISDPSALYLDLERLNLQKAGGEFNRNFVTRIVAPAA